MWKKWIPISHHTDKIAKCEKQNDKTWREVQNISITLEGGRLMNQDTKHTSY